MNIRLFKGSISLLLIFVLISGTILVPTVASSAPAGSGTQQDPYLISTSSDLVWISDNINICDYSYFRQINDIDMSGVSFIPIGTLSNMFKGTYDGCGRSISNLTINTDSIGNVGLFGFISGATVKNINLINVNIKTTVPVNVGAGGVAGWSGNGLVQSCSVSGTVESTVITSSVGGIVGNNQGMVENCYSTATVKAKANTTAALGGITGYTGYTSSSYVKNCYFAGDFAGIETTTTGGVVGNNYYGTISNNYFINTATTYGVSSTSGSGTNSGATPKTDADLKKTFPGWDTSIWYFNDNVDYPRLRAPAPYSADISIYGRPVGISDTVTVSNRVAGETVSVYDSPTGGNLLGSGVVEAGQTSVDIDIGDLTASSGSIYVAATTVFRTQEGPRQKIDYTAPDAPIGLKISVGYEKVVLDWEPVPGAVSYKIYKGTESGSYTYDSTVTSNTATITGLTNGTEYYFVVRAFTGFESTNSAEVSGIPGLYAPSNVRATVDTGTVELSWTGVVGISSYNIYYGTESGVYGSPMSSGTTKKTITGLTNGVSYYFAVTSVSGSNESGYSTEITAIPALFSFSIPLNVSFDDTDMPKGWVSTNLDTAPYSENLEWSVCDSSTADDYELSRVAPHSGSYMLKANTYMADDGSSARFHMNQDLVMPSSGVYELSFYTYLSLNNWGCTDNIIPQISIDGGASWIDLDGPIYNEQAEGTLVWKKYSYTLDSSYNGKSVRFGFLGTSNYGYNLYIDDIEVNEIVTVPGAPTNVVATAGDESASVRFDAPYNGGSEITGYTAVPYIGTTAQSSLSATGTSSPILVSGLTNGTEYTFKVFATNSKGNSIESSSSNAVTPIRIGPKWSTEYPKAGLMGTTTGQVLVKTDSAGKVYYAVMPDNAAAPSAADLKSGIVSGSIANGSISVSSETEAQINITGLSEKTDYDVYVAAEDNAATPVMQATVTKVEILTLWNASEPIINTHPSNVIADIGEIKNISVSASGSGSLSYQWYKNSVMSTDGAELIADGTNATYQVPTSASGTTYYYCIVTNTDNTATGTKTAAATSDFSTVIVRTAVNITGLSVNNKTYDGSAETTLNTASVLLSGVASTDNVTLDITNAVVSFVDKNAGTEKAVAISGLALSGADAYKYTLIQPTGLKGDITAKTLTPSATVEDKVYDGSATTTATVSLEGVVGTDDVTATGTASFEDANAGEGKRVNVTGITLSGADKDNYVLTSTETSTTANIAAKATTITMENGSFEYDGTEKSLTAVSSDGVEIKYTNNGQTEAGVYTVTASSNNPNYSGSTTATLEITKKALTVTGLTVNSKTYDGTLDATLSGGTLEGIVGTDDVTATMPTSGTFASKNAGTGIDVAISEITLAGAKAGNYTLIQPTGLKGDITAKTLTPSATVEDKVYDGSAAATATVSLEGVVGTDDVTATGTASFEDANAGEGKRVNVTGITLSGADKDNYVLSSTETSTTANIAAKATTITMENRSFEYDGTEKSLTAVSSDGVEIKYTNNGQTEAGTYTVTASSNNPNYSGSTTATLEITKKALTVTGLTVNSKTYDGKFDATLSGGTLEGIVGTDDVTATMPTSGTFASKNAGTGIDVAISEITLEGAKAGNYTLIQPTGLKGDITAKEITPSATVEDKVYDGSAAATATVSLEGVVGTDDVTATGTASFEDANAGEGKRVNVTGITLSGADKDNYVLSSTETSTTANIAAKATTITMENGSFEYDGTEKSLTAVSSDGVEIKYTNNGQTEAGTYTVTASSNNPNYSGSTTATLEITKKALTVTGLTVNSKTYDGKFDATLSGGALEGIVGTDDVTATMPTSGTFASKNAGTGIDVAISEITLAGADANNYTLIQPTGLKGDITAKTLTPSATVEDKVYDGSATATATVSLEGVVGTDDVTATGTASFEDANAGEGKRVNVTGITLSGADKDNYVLSSTEANTTANIAAKATTITMENGSFEYDGTEKSLTAVSSDGVEIKYTNNGQTEAGVYTVTASSNNSNYSGSTTATLEITKKALTVTGLTVNSKIYDGTLDATLSGGTLQGIVGTDDVTATMPTSGTFASKNAGTGIDVAISEITLAGADANNYTLIQPTGLKGDIIAETAHEVTVVAETSYDGNWTNEDVLFTLSGDAPSGLAKYQYSIDNGESWKDASNDSILDEKNGFSYDFIITETTDFSYIFRSVSNGGVASNCTEAYSVKVDKLAPVIENITGNPTEFINAEQVITFTAGDTNSGVNKQSVSVIKGETAIEVTENNGVFSFTTQGNGKYNISISDNVSNKSDVFVVDVTKLDFEKPIVSAFTPANNELEVDTDSLTATFNENIKKSNINGDIVVYRKDGTVFEKVDIQNNRVKISDKQLKIYFTKSLEPDTTYYVKIAKDIILDIGGNSFDGISDNTTWVFKTKKSASINSLIGIDVTVQGEQYPAIVDTNDATTYTVTAKASKDGTIEAVIIPKFILSGASLAISTTEEGVTINNNNIKITDTSKNQTILNLQIKNSDGTIDTTKTYKLIIVKGNVETKVENRITEFLVDSDDLKGSVDVSSEIEQGKQLELVLKVSDTKITDEQKAEINKTLSDQSIALYMDISLMLKNITDNTTVTVSNTQNPITIRIKLPKNMKGGSNYKVIRSHNGIIDILDAELDGDYLVFETDRFSCYAIAYTKPEKENNDDNSSRRSTTKQSIIAAAVSKHTSYIKGYSDNTFRPDSLISRAEVATILSRLSEKYDENLYYANSFTDVVAGGWYSNAIGYCSQNGLVNGYEDGSFMPDGNMTRAEFAAVIARLKNLSITDNNDTVFSDTSEHWAKNYIAALHSQGWIQGYEDGTFKPESCISRAEAVKIINAAMGRTPNKEKITSNISNYKHSFSDITDSHWAYYDILEAALDHIITDFN